jgi:hypothetical protein
MVAVLFNQTSSAGDLSLRGHFSRVREGTLSKSFNTDLAETSTSRSFPRYTCTAPVHGTPMREIKKEPDWKLLRRVHPLALERFRERVPAEIDRVSHDGATGHLARLE